ncbi:ABC1-domain-containing protein [Phlebopus sp. FC_14]|nr:ABC1-domain-containing protein [Phlebopus sp. FC_14]
MPPGPAFGWLCVAHSVADIVFQAAQIRNAGVLPRHAAPRITISDGIRVASGGDSVSSKGAEDLGISPRNAPEETGAAVKLSDTEVCGVQTESRPTEHFGSSRIEDIVDAPATQEGTTGYAPPVKSASSGVGDGLASTEMQNATDSYLEARSPPTEYSGSDYSSSRNLQSSKVPSSRIGRLFHYGGLAASLGYGAASEILRRSASSSDNSNGQQSSLMMTEANIKRLVSKLSQMRGAALKLGQFMSIQDTNVLPPEVDNIFRIVQDSAHYMPDWQMEGVLSSALGPSWIENFTSFDRIPFAAASIGQVHHAVLTACASPTGREEAVAVKIQFPNIADSIASDLGYVKMLLTAGRLLPKGLFLERTIQVMKDELAGECDYSREAEFLRRYNTPELLGQDIRFKIPWVWEGSTNRVLVMEHVDGVSVGDPLVAALLQVERNEIAARIIELCLRELFEFRLMQTDPNWTNFLWNSSAQQVSLVDFGATREYTKEFMDNWLHLLQAAASEDRDGCVDWSLKLRYITGEENEVMLNAHIESMMLLATPFKNSTPQPFAFGLGSQWADITNQIRERIPVMLKYRLTPPPRETYSLNRKLSGAFLLAARLNAVVDTKMLWDKVVDNYRFN